MDSFRVFHNSQLLTVGRQELSSRLKRLLTSDIDDVKVVVRDDLTLLKSGDLPLWSRVGWHLSRHSSWLKQYLYNVNVEETLLSLELIEKQLATDPFGEKELTELFEKAVAHFNHVGDVAGGKPYKAMTLAIHRAVWKRDLRSVIRLVISDHSYLYLCNSLGETPLHLSFKKGFSEISHFLISESPKECATLMICDAVAGNTPLHMAVLANDSSNVMALLRKKVDLTIVNKNGLTPLSLARQQGNKTLYIILYEYNAKRYNRYF